MVSKNPAQTYQLGEARSQASRPPSTAAGDRFCSGDAGTIAFSSLSRSMAPQSASHAPSIGASSSHGDGWLAARRLK